MHVGLVTRGEVDYAYDLASALSGDGNSVTLYLSHSHAVSSIDEPHRAVDRLYELGVVAPACKVRLFRLPRMRDPRSLVTTFRICQAIRKDRVDIVHILMGPGEPWLAVLGWFLTGIPLVSTLITPFPNIGELYQSWIVPLQRLLTQRSDMVIVNGANQVEDTKKMYRIPSGKLAYVPLCARTSASAWSLQTQVEEQGSILFFGRIEPHKGLEYLVRAQPLISRRIPAARFLVVGEGHDLMRCKSMMRDRGKFDIHEGYVSGAEMAHYFQRASVVVLPYTTASTSGVLLTAYSFGKPVVATRVGCLPEYVVDGVTGLLISPTSVEELAEAIVGLLRDDDVRHQMGKNARRWMMEVHRLSVEHTLAVYEIAIHNHLGNYKSKAV